MSDAVLYHREDTTGVITLNRPDNRNSMTPELLDAFAHASRQAMSDQQIRCVVITGNGRCFSAGADFKSQLQREDDARPLMPAERSFAMYEPFLSVLDIEVPVIGALNGHAVGGGFGLAMICDIRIANRGSKYGANFTRLGLSSGMAISYLLPRLVGVSKAAELLFTGRLFRGSEAEQMGLVSSAVDDEEVLARAMELATEIGKSAPVAIRFTKQLLYQGLDWNPRAHAHAESFAQATTVATEDCAEGVKALLEKRDPVFHGR
jgi:enoyl-CoA hydratase/carnithine racemase